MISSAGSSASPKLRLFCCGRKSIAKWMPLSSRPGIGRSRGLVAPIVEHDRVVLRAHLVGVDVDADAAVGHNLEALGFHLLDAPIDDPLFQLEIGNAVDQQSADAIRALVERHRMSRARELLRACEPRRSRAHDCDALAGLLRGRQRRDPFFRPGVIDDVLLDQFDRDRIVVDVQHAGFFTRRGTDSAGELRKIVGRMQAGRSPRATCRGKSDRSSRE